MYSRAFRTSDCICRCQAFTASQTALDAFVRASILGPQRQMMRISSFQLFSRLQIYFTRQDPPKWYGNPPTFECNYCTFFRQRSVTRYENVTRAIFYRLTLVISLLSPLIFFSLPEIVALVSTRDSWERWNSKLKSRKSRCANITWQK